MADDRRRAMAFLVDHLPESDLDCCPESLFGQFADHAVFLRRTVPWCATLEQEVFDHYVLFPRVNDEDLSFHRKIFYDALWPRIQGLSTMEQRILEVNRWCHEMASYQAQDDRTASPLTVFRNGSGRCGEESAFLVSALRSVGIPARQVYAPRWAHCDDNHAWVETLCDGQWRFLGACEPEPVLDRGWFNTAASRGVLVHSRLFGEGTSPLHGELLGREGAVCWYNQTRRYARVRTCTFQAVCGDVPAAGAVFQIQLLNEGSFHTIASLTADGQGQARAELGMGDLHVLVTWKGLWAEGDCTDGEITLRLAPYARQDTEWKALDVHAPKAEPVNPAPLNEQQRIARAAVLRQGTALRERRLAAFYPPELPESLRAARANCQRIAAFLRRDGDPRREWLVGSLADKDLRDVTAEILEDHLQNTPLPGDLPLEIYVPYVLCPRIEWEPLTAWRGKLRQALTGKETPQDLWRELNRRMDTGVSRTYSNLVWTPLESWRSGRCDKRSLRILYVACLRALGIPARLRLLDGMPEYWHCGDFHPVQEEETGMLQLTFPGDTLPRYRQSWTLSRQTETGWQLLHLPEGVREVQLPAGYYRLITASRLPNGNQFANLRDFSILPGKTRTIELLLRSYALADMLLFQTMPSLSAVTMEGSPVPDVFRMAGGPAVLIWIEPDGEPTEHVLNELAAEEFAGLPVFLLLRKREDGSYPTLAKLLTRRHSIRILLDDWAYDLEAVARELTCDPETPPLAVVCDGKGRAVFGTSGYRVGVVSLLEQIADSLREQSEKGSFMFAPTVGDGH